MRAVRNVWKYHVSCLTIDLSYALWQRKLKRQNFMNADECWRIVDRVQAASKGDLEIKGGLRAVAFDFDEGYDWNAASRLEQAAAVELKSRPVLKGIKLTLAVKTPEGGPSEGWMQKLENRGL
jgi:hypothetical protein